MAPSHNPSSIHTKLASAFHEALHSLPSHVDRDQTRFLLKTVLEDVAMPGPVKNSEQVPIHPRHVGFVSPQGTHTASMLESIALLALISPEEYSSTKQKKTEPANLLSDAAGRPCLHYHMGATHQAATQEDVSPLLHSLTKHRESFILPGQQQQNPPPAGIIMPALLASAARTAGSAAHDAFPTVVRGGDSFQVVVQFKDMEVWDQVLVQFLKEVQAEKETAEAAGLSYSASPAQVAVFPMSKVWRAVTGDADIGLHAQQCAVMPDMYRPPVEEWIQKLAGTRFVLSSQDGAGSSSGVKPCLFRELLWLQDVVCLMVCPRVDLNPRQQSMLEEWQDVEPLQWAPWAHLLKVQASGGAAGLTRARACLASCIDHISLTLPCPLLSSTNTTLIDIPATCFSSPHPATPLIELHQLVVVAEESLQRDDAEGLMDRVAGCRLARGWFPKPHVDKKDDNKEGEGKKKRRGRPKKDIVTEEEPLPDCSPLLLTFCMTRSSLGGASSSGLSLQSLQVPGAADQLRQALSADLEVVTEQYTDVLMDVVRKVHPKAEELVVDKAVAELKDRTTCIACVPAVATAIPTLWQAAHVHAQPQPPHQETDFMLEDTQQVDGADMKVKLSDIAEGILQQVQESEVQEIQSAAGFGTFLSNLILLNPASGVTAAAEVYQQKVKAFKDSLSGLKGTIVEACTEYAQPNIRKDLKEKITADSSEEDPRAVQRLSALAAAVQGRLSACVKDVEKQTVMVAGPLPAFLRYKLYTPVVEQELWTTFSSAVVATIANDYVLAKQTGTVNLAAMRVSVSKNLHHVLTAGCLKDTVSVAIAESVKATASVCAKYAHKLMDGVALPNVKECLMKKIEHEFGGVLVHLLEEWPKANMQHPEALEDLVDLAMHWQIDMAPLAGDLSTQTFATWEEQFKALQPLQQALLASIQQGMKAYVHALIHQYVQDTIYSLESMRKRAFVKLAMFVQALSEAAGTPSEADAADSEEDALAMMLDDSNGTGEGGEKLQTDEGGYAPELDAEDLLSDLEQGCTYLDSKVAALTDAVLNDVVLPAREIMGHAGAVLDQVLPAAVAAAVKVVSQPAIKSLIKIQQGAAAAEVGALEAAQKLGVAGAAALLLSEGVAAVTLPTGKQLPSCTEAYRQRLASLPVPQGMPAPALPPVDFNALGIPLALPPLGTLAAFGGNAPGQGGLPHMRTGSMHDLSMLPQLPLPALPGVPAYDQGMPAGSDAMMGAEYPTPEEMSQRTHSMDGRNPSPALQMLAGSGGGGRLPGSAPRPMARVALRAGSDLLPDYGPPVEEDFSHVTFDVADDEAFAGMLKVIRELPEHTPYIPYKVVCSIMSGSGSKLNDHTTRQALLQRCHFKKLSYEQRRDLITADVIIEVSKRQRAGRAQATLDDQWYEFAPPLPAELPPPGVSDYEWAMHWVMLDMALMRYGWEVSEVDTGAIQLQGRVPGTNTFNYLVVKNGVAKQHQDLAKAVVSYYGVRNRRSKSRPPAGSGNKRRKFMEDDFYDDTQAGAEALTILSNGG